MTPQDPSSTYGWLERRFPVIRLIRREYGAFPMPANLNLWWNFGAFLILTILCLVASGLFLAMAYTPDVHDAFKSVETIDRHIPSGWFIRSMHMGGVTLLFGCLYIHTARSLWYGSYKAPREFLWLTGLGLMLMLMCTAFAGYVLPWGQMSYWGATVVLNAVRAVPLIGRPIADLVTGGQTLGSIALHRFFVLHFAMAFAVLAMIGIHVAALHVVRPNNPSGVDPSPARTLPFHPYYTSRDGFGICLFLLVYGGLVFYAPGLLTLAENYVQADPLVTPHSITPEWYFAPFYAILRAVPSRLGGLVLATGSLAVLFVLPWMDRSPVRPATRRPVIRISLSLAFIAFGTLDVAGMQVESTFWLTVSRVATGWWFFHFLVITPLISEREQTP